MKIGCTTGFTRDMVNILLREAEKQGYVPDAAIAGDDVENGVRPKPFMLYKNLEIMDVSPIASVVKVGSLCFWSLIMFFKLLLFLVLAVTFTDLYIYFLLNQNLGIVDVRSTASVVKEGFGLD